MGYGGEIICKFERNKLGFGQNRHGLDYENKNLLDRSKHRNN